MKKFLSVLLCVAMVLSFVTVSFAAEKTTVNATDFDTIVTSNASGDSGYTKTYTTTNGWTTVNCASQTGGDKDSNPQYIVIGPDNTHKAVCLNGKTSAPGKITSPTLTGGISKLTMNYTKMFSDTNLSVTITVTDIANSKTYTKTVARTVDGTADKYVKWTEEWTLETPVTGDFKIEIVNDCPSKNTGNKDRFTILDLSWTAAGGSTTPEVNKDEEAAKAVDALIEKIGTVNKDSKAAIEAARAAYTALTDAQKALVTKLDVLTAAEKAFAELPTEPEKPATTPTYVTKLAVGTAYKLGLFSTSKNAAYYFTGKMSGYYGATETAYDKGIDVFVEETEGGYHLYFMDGETKQYINLVASGTYRNFKFENTATSVYTWDADKNALNTTVSGEVCYIGTYGTYVTMGVLQTSKLKDTDYIARLYTMATTPETPEVNKDEEAAKAVDALIEKIGTVNKDSKAAIEAARAAYTALTDAQKALVTKLDVLTAAEKAFAELPTEPEKPAADKVYTMTDYVTEELGGSACSRDLDETVKLSITSGWFTTQARIYKNANGVLSSKKAMSSVILNMKANKAGNFTFDVYVSEDGVNWTMAFENVAYTGDAANITLDFKTPTKYIKLEATDAQIRLNTIAVNFAKGGTEPTPNPDETAAKAVVDQIAAIGEVTLEKETAITAARAAYAALTDAQKALVTNIDVLVAAEDALATLKSQVKPGGDGAIDKTGDGTMMFVAMALLSMTALVVLVSKKKAY
jgi:hypothetical protein